MKNVTKTISIAQIRTQLNKVIQREIIHNTKKELKQEKKQAVIA